jgi:cobalamin synthase
MATASAVLARIPGLTGDIYGALCEITEVAALLFFVIIQTTL